MKVTKELVEKIAKQIEQKDLEAAIYREIEDRVWESIDYNKIVKQVAKELEGDIEEIGKVLAQKLLKKIKTNAYVEF